jgi:hypothetical protein
MTHEFGMPALRTAAPVAASDAAGYVQATVRADGRLLALWVNPHAMYDLTAEQLAEACLEAVVRAQSVTAHPGRR